MQNLLSHNKTSSKKVAGFTLLEIMIAIAILAIAFVILLGTQARTITLATESDFYLKAPMLAAIKLAEYESGLTDIIEDEGEFPNASGYSWSTIVENYIPDKFVTTENDNRKLQKLTLTITLAGSNFQYSVTSYYSANRESK